jgi:hypothetical protein
MPLEIRELHIRTVVGAEPRGTQTQRTRPELPEDDVDAIVAEAVAQVLDVLERSAER